MRVSKVVAATAITAAAFMMSSAVAQDAGQPTGSFSSWPIGSKAPVTIQTESRPSVSVDSAEQRAIAKAIIERAERESGRPFDPAWRDSEVDRLAKKPVIELDNALRDSRVLIPAPSFLGSSQADLSYTPLTPCRIIDTRAAGGPIAAGTSRSFKATAASFSGQGGSPGTCGVPFGPATAAVINFTAIGATATGPGNLAATPTGTPFTTSAIVNWTAGTNIANAVTVPLCNPNVTGCAFDFDIKANVNSVNVVADVLGYFAAPQASALSVDAVAWPSPSTYSSCGSLFNCFINVACTANSVVTGGGCEVADSNSGYKFIWYINGPFNNGWACKGTNTEGFAQSIRVWAMCSRTPGR
jgi:hypothetical protein